VNAQGELRFRAKPGWILADDGELVPDREVLKKRVREAEEGPEVEEAVAALAGDLEQAYVETPEEDRSWVFAQAKGWQVRERGVVYGERSRGIAGRAGHENDPAGSSKAVRWLIPVRWRVKEDRKPYPPPGCRVALARWPGEATYRPAGHGLGSLGPTQWLRPASGRSRICRIVTEGCDWS
jgi:hypothetical protein